MSAWRPSLPAFLEAMHSPLRWGVDLGDFTLGIDNAHIDVHLSPGYHETAGQTVRKLIAEQVAGLLHGTPTQLVGLADLEGFRQAYLGLFEAAVARPDPSAAVAGPVLLQLSLLKWALQAVALANRALQQDYKHSGQDPEVIGSGRSLELHEQLVLLLRQGPLIERRVLQILLRQMHKVETDALDELRRALLTGPWPLPTAAQFNPVLLAISPESPDALAADYPVAQLAEGGAVDWLLQANTALVDAFAAYLPEHCRRTAHPKVAGAAPERRDQGLLQGFLATELLLSHFVASEEYRAAKVSWLDEPENLQRLLDLPGAAASARRTLEPASWGSPDWLAFRADTRALLHRRLEHWGLGERIVLAYWLPALRRQFAQPVPLGLVSDYCSGLLPKRRLGARLAALNLPLDPAGTAGVLERSATALRRFGPAERGHYLDRFLVDFLVLRRDLKLAYKTFEAMDRVRLLTEPGEVALSRANGTLYEFLAASDAASATPMIRAHVVIKADVRGSTRMTDELCARGLNPASHFSLNLFTPVNNLLGEFGAEKLFVEGDAVILAIYDDGGAGGETGADQRTGAGTAVARACGLARSILDVVALQNALNRKHGLPALELGIGIAYAAREPHFLYDEGRRIMISPAVNAADRLSACSARLRAAEWVPPEPAWRVYLVRQPAPRDGSEPESLLAYNVNGIHLGATAFYQLQREIDLRRTRLNTTNDADIYFVGSYQDRRGRNRTLAVRCARVHDWRGGRLGPRDPQGRHYFEVITDDSILAALRSQRPEAG